MNQYVIEVRPKAARLLWCSTAPLIIAASLVACSKAESPKSEAVTATDTSREYAAMSSDKNLAEALLYRWWGIFEAPDDVDVTFFFDDLFTPDVYLAMPGVELSGGDAIRAAFTNLPADNGRSHQLIDVTVAPIDDTTLQIDARFTYQIARPDGSIDAGHSGYQHQAVKLADGTFRLAKLTAKLGDKLDIAEFEPSYAANRARGTLVQYLGITDVLDSDYDRLRLVLGEDTQVHGMFDPALETHNVRGDGVLKGIDEISAWLGTRSEKFSWVSHTVDAMTVDSLGDGAYRASATVAVQAQPIDGALIDVTLPIELTLVDNNERFMMITSIKR